MVDRLDPIFAALAPGKGDIPRRPAARAAMRVPSRATCMPAPSGAGHFVKMIHNGIEYGMMQAIAEGFDILKERQLAERCPTSTAARASTWPTWPRSGGAAASSPRGCSI